MKPLLVTMAILLMTSGFAHGIKTIDNPEQPVKKDTGKILQLKEVLQIHDIEGSYYFTEPYNLKISSNGAVFLSDEYQLLKFNVDGKFFKNFYKHGQGPREVTWVMNYLIEGEKLLIHDKGQNKIVIYNHENGEYIKEFRLPETNYSICQLFYSYNSNLYFLKKDIMDTGGKLKIVNVEQSILSLSSDGTRYEKKIGFPVSYCIIRTGERFFLQDLSNSIFSPVDGDRMYFSNTSEYDVKLYSFKDNTIIQEFTRDYKRVKVTAENRSSAPGGNFGKIGIGNGQFHKMPVPEYHPDIQTLLYFKDRLWVITSTTVEDKNSKRVLVDVYNADGVYEENFYIECPPFLIPLRIREWIKAINGDFLYAVEEDKDGSRFIKKYIIEGLHR